MSGGGGLKEANARWTRVGTRMATSESSNQRSHLNTARMFGANCGMDVVCRKICKFNILPISSLFYDLVIVVVAAFCLILYFAFACEYEIS